RAGIPGGPTAGLISSEAAAATTFTVALTPHAALAISIPLSSGNPAEAAVTPSSLTFTPDNWNQAQTVTVRGVADQVDDGDVAYTIVTGAAQGHDAKYRGMNPADVAVVHRNLDPARTPA